MITSSGHIKVMDFGIARAIADTAATMTQTAVGRRHRPVPLARAGPGPDRRRALRPLLDRVPPVRAARRPAAVHRRLAGRHRLPARRGAAPAAERLQRRRRRRPRRRHAARPRQGPRGPLPGRHRLPRRPRERPARPPDQRGGPRAPRPPSGAAATQTLPQSYAVAGTPTAVQSPVTARSERYANTAGLPAVGHDEEERRGQGRQGQGRAHHGRSSPLVLGPHRLGCGDVVRQPDAGGRSVAVPTIEGMDGRRRRSALRTNNLRGQKSTAASTTVTEGDVISPGPQGRHAGSPSTRWSVRRVDRARTTLTVPDVTGFDKDEARSRARGRRASWCRTSGGEHPRPGRRTR